MKLNLNKIEKIVSGYYDTIWNNCSGCSTHSLFWSWDGLNSIEEEVEAFLIVFKRLVDDGIILVLPPIKGEPTKKVPNDIANDDFWDVSSDKMIEYIRSVLPKNLKFLNGGLDDKDDEYSKFWYSECPEIRWVDKNDNNKVY